MSAPAWHTFTLRAAGVYNVLWGAAAGLAPHATLRLLGVDDPASPAVAFWQTIGMIVGVYGVGYWIAARDPVRHWPIVLVGLLGKVLGPIGFVFTALSADIPWSFGATILTNDLLWWIPFTLILLHAFRASRAVDARAGVAA